jgi:thiamine pyrophosphate-dependent acetolactate synthase large subunit-like protein
VRANVIENDDVSRVVVGDDLLPEPRQLEEVPRLAYVTAMAKQMPVAVTDLPVDVFQAQVASAAEGN